MPSRLKQMDEKSYIYLLASIRNGTLYVGVTSDLVRRVSQLREGSADGFTSKYGVKTLVWYEIHEDIEAAIAREKAIKKWNRAWRLRLIEKSNPDCHDLFGKIAGGVEDAH